MFQSNPQKPKSKKLADTLRLKENEIQLLKREIESETEKFRTYQDNVINLQQKGHFMPALHLEDETELIASNKIYRKEIDCLAYRIGEINKDLGLEEKMNVKFQEEKNKKEHLCSIEDSMEQISKNITKTSDDIAETKELLFKLKEEILILKNQERISLNLLNSFLRKDSSKSDTKVWTTIQNSLELRSSIKNMCKEKQFSPAEPKSNNISLIKAKDTLNLMEGNSHMKSYALSYLKNLSYSLAHKMLEKEEKISKFNGPNVALLERFLSLNIYGGEPPLSIPLENLNSDRTTLSNKKSVSDIHCKQPQNLSLQLIQEKDVIM